MTLCPPHHKSFILLLSQQILIWMHRPFINWLLSFAGCRVGRAELYLILHLILNYSALDIDRATLKYTNNMSCTRIESCACDLAARDKLDKTLCQVCCFTQKVPYFPGLIEQLWLVVRCVSPLWLDVWPVFNQSMLVLSSPLTCSILTRTLCCRALLLTSYVFQSQISCIALTYIQLFYSIHAGAT